MLIKENNMENFKNKNPFSTPPQYFENFPSKMQNRLNEIKETKQQKAAFYRQPSFVYVFTCSIFLLLGGIFYLNQNKEAEQAKILITFTNEELNHLIDSSIYIFNNEYIMEAAMEENLFTDNDIFEYAVNDLNINTLTDSLQTNDTNSQDAEYLIDYLVSSDVDIDDILAEL